MMGMYSVGDVVKVVGQHDSQKFELGKSAMVIEVEYGGQTFPYLISQYQIDKNESNGSGTISYKGWVASHHLADPDDELINETPSPIPDGLLRPDYYRLPNGIEAHQVSGWFPTNIGVAINYLWRAGRKPGSAQAEDLQKAIEHIQFEIERLGSVKPINNGNEVV